MTIEPIEKWGLDLGSSPVIISGPCSAETENQLTGTAMGLHNIGIRVLRAGIWKPRTRPGSFEGVGTIGLTWLKHAKEKTGMLTCVEVANVKHVYEALKGGVDILWIGARTTVNPFAIQEIAEALKGTSLPILVKNPICPDIGLWIGAFERLNKAGITKIAAVHRGFSCGSSSIYRNVPKWQIPVNLKKEIPGLSIICDPSHIAGNRSLLKPVSQKALNLGFEGLMIESHIRPFKARTDSKQQITPLKLKELLENLSLQ